ncbi:hypothetical protein V6Z11_D09G143500 [Gossypium hirsutum]
MNGQHVQGIISTNFFRCERGGDMSHLLSGVHTCMAAMNEELGAAYREEEVFAALKGMHTTKESDCGSKWCSSGESRVCQV